MSGLVTVKKTVEDIKQRIMPKPLIDHVIIGSWGSTDSPHGVYGGNRLHLNTGLIEACSVEFELEEMKEYYEQEVPKFCKVKGHVFGTFESFSEYYRCKCGKHGSNGLEPYQGCLLYTSDAADE